MPTQIRAGCKQDEPLVKELILAAMKELNIKVDLQGKDKDLNNLEHYYFWHDGLFIVAEENKQILGVLAACSKKDTGVLKLCHLVVIPSMRYKGIAKSLIDTMRFFAINMEYTKVILDLQAWSKTLCPKLLISLGFVQEKALGLWLLGK